MFIWNFIYNTCTTLGEIVTDTFDGLVRSVKIALHEHDYEPITSIYYRENGEIRYHDTVCKCSICGRKETFRKEITKKKQLYQVCCKNTNDYNLNCLMVGTTMEEIDTRIGAYLERINNLQILPFVGINPLETVDGLKVNIGENLYDE